MLSSPKFIELSEQELLSKTGLFRNSLTGRVWKLSIQDKKLMVEVPNYSFQISALSSTQFRPVNPVINIDFEFEQPSQNQPLLLQLSIRGVKRATFAAIQEL